MSHPLSESTFQAIARPARRAVWKYVAGLMPVIVIWAVLVGWLAWLLYDRGMWSEESDRAAVREWLDEARNFRKTLPELVREYAHVRDDDPAGGDPRRQEAKRAEVIEHMRSLVEPTRAYVNQLPLFPEIYRLEVVLASPTGEPEALAWVSAVPKPIRQTRDSLRLLEYRPFGDDRAVIRCEYRLHAFNKLERREQERQQLSLIAGVLLLTATALAILFVTRFLRRAHRYELDRLSAVAEIEHQELELLQAQRRQDEAVRAQQQLELEAAALQSRAAEAERTTLEMKSQLYASIGIMAGSYAHNIKNLLVRPNDLLSRCIEVNGLSPDQEGMLHEVKSTLGTVTERLQQILKTVRRDPANAEVTKLDLAALVRDSATTWADMGRDKWKLKITAAVPAEPVVIVGDVSHLQQAIENLVFNARDATFEMRNWLREEARHAADRKAALLAAAGWKGEVHLSVRRDAAGVVLEVRDNGIGMSEETRAKCLQPHYTTKRDNALYEGYTAGMGLGLSFVAMVLDHHRATVAIESEVRKGTTFLVTFPFLEPRAEATG